VTTRLRRLQYTKVALVDRGANPLAHIQLFKRDDPMSKSPTADELAAQLAEVTKAKEEAEAKVAALTAEVEKLTPKPEPAPEDVEKALPEAVQKELAKLRKQAEEDRAAVAKMQEERDRAAAIRKAADYKPLGAPDDLGAFLYEIRRADPRLADRFDAMAKGWTEQLRQSALFKAVGHDAIDADSPEGQLDALAKRHATEHKTTYEQGYAAVMQTAEGARLYKAIRQGGK
jgi:hypothetical protein